MVRTIGDWEISPDTCTLRRARQTRHVTPRAMDVLVYLADHHDHTVGVSDLLERFWPNPLVGDTAVYKVISELRHALGEDPKQPKYLQTIPKRGYQLVAEVSGDAEVVAARAAQESPSLVTSSTNPRAREAYRKGVYQGRRLDTEGLLSAKAFLEEAVTLDERFVEAYVALAWTLWDLAIFQVRPGQRDALRQQYIGILGELEELCPNSSQLNEVRLHLARLTHAALPGTEEGLRQTYLDDNTYHEFFRRYGELLLAARLPREALKYVNKYAELCPDEPRYPDLAGILRDLGDTEGT